MNWYVYLIRGRLRIKRTTDKNMSFLYNTNPHIEEYRKCKGFKEAYKLYKTYNKKGI